MNPQYVANTPPHYGVNNNAPPQQYPGAPYNGPEGSAPYGMQPRHPMAPGPHPPDPQHMGMSPKMPGAPQGPPVPGMMPPQRMAAPAFNGRMPAPPQLQPYGRGAEVNPGPPAPQPHLPAPSGHLSNQMEAMSLGRQPQPQPPQGYYGSDSSVKPAGASVNGVPDGRYPQSFMNAPPRGMPAAPVRPPLSQQPQPAHPAQPLQQHPAPPQQHAPPQQLQSPARPPMGGPPRLGSEMPGGPGPLPAGPAPGMRPPMPQASQMQPLPSQPQQQGNVPYSAPGMPPMPPRPGFSFNRMPSKDMFAGPTSHMPPPAGQMPPQGGHLPPQPGPGHMPAQHMPPQPGHMPPPMGGHMPPQMGHMPPQPAQHMPPQPSYPTPQPSYPNQAAQQNRRLDPDQMPSPIQVMLEDQRSRSGPFYTNQRGQVPPLVTTDFVTHDQGNANPRFIRASMYSVPATIDMMKQTSVPFSLVISPLAELMSEELPPPIVDLGEMGPIRCIRCKAYMSSFMQFVDGGRRFHCLLCKATTEVPPDYFQHLDHTGQRVDRFERPELMLGAYEFVATKEYCRNETLPNPPAIIFVIDVSYNNIKSGMVQLLCREMRNILTNLPRDQGQEKSNMKVGFITFSSAVHYYNIKGTLAQPKMLVVGDTQDMFMPLLDGFLCEPSEAMDMIDSLMEQIPLMFGDTRETDTILAPAIQAGLEALKESNCPGKLIVFLASLPIAEAPGKLKNRDDRKLLGTDKEKTVLSPQSTFYNNLGQDCVKAGCGVDLFLFNNSYIDIATVSQVSRLTGGQVYKYTYFQAEYDGPRLIADLSRNVSRNVGFDAIMRVRTSTGVRPTDFFGHFFMANTTDMEMGCIDTDKAVAVEVKHDDKLTEEEGVFVQVALLYTSCGGQRRLRILNLALKTCVQMADLYRGCDLDTIVNFLSKQSLVKLLEHSPKPVKDALVSRCAQMLACYRKNCASPSSAGQLILPECMKLLPLYLNCILKSDALSGGSDMTVDDRSFIMSVVSTMDIPSSVAYFYPRLLPLHELAPGDTQPPPPIRCSSDKLRDDGVYLLDNGIHMFLWVGANVSPEWSHSVFGDHLVATIEIDRTSLPVLDNPVSQQLRSIVDIVKNQRQRATKLTIIPQRDKLELVFKHFLVEDRGMDGSASYVDFLCHMHKEIRNLLS